MDGKELRNARARKSLSLAIVVSLLVHAAILFIGFSSSGQIAGPAGNPNARSDINRVTRPPLQATLARPVAPPAKRSEATLENATRKPASASKKQTPQPKLTAPAGVWANRTFSQAERSDMDNFLNELATQAKPPTGRELSKKALAMARQLGRAQDDGEEEPAGQRGGDGKVIEPFSLEMYFDAFVRKLNRSAAFVNKAPRVRGAHKALVQISLNPDGSLKSYRVLRSGDQEAEIAYIKSVIDRASPFSAFPPDIRNSTGALSILMCIYPPGEGGGGGFSRSFGGQDCKD